MNAMTRLRRVLRGSPLLYSLALLALSGCFASIPVQEQSLLDQGLPEAQPSDEVLTIFKGTRDTRNRFSSTVYISLSKVEECSGVLIHPRLVLTAGHCLCRGREENGTTTIDSSTCEKTAVVKTGVKEEVFTAHSGEVHPHRDFKVVLKKKKLLVPPGAQVENFIIEGGKRYVVIDVVVEAQADLAVILLEKPVERRFSPTRVASTDIHLQDRVITVGYGADEVSNGLVAFTDDKPFRRFGRNSVTQVDGDLFAIERPGALPLPGDSGGPCFRDEDSGPVLVGISSRTTPGKKATFTSTYRYLGWLAAEMKQADSLKTNVP